MKTILVGIAALIVATPLVAGAQTTRPSDRPASDRGTTTKQSDARPAWKAEGAVVDSSDIVGTRIRDGQGKDLGEIDRLIIDPQSGRITHVVVGVGGLMGVGEKKIVVPWSELKMAGTQDGRKAVVVMDRSKLENAPRFERTARTDRSPAASPATSPARDTDRDGKRDSTDKAPSDPTKK